VHQQEEILNLSFSDDDSAVNMAITSTGEPVIGLGSNDIPEEDVPTFRTITETNMRNDKFKIDHRIIRVELQGDAAQLLGVPAAIAEIMDEERRNPGVNDFVGFTIHSNSGGKDIEVEFRRQTEISEAAVMNELSSVVQSNTLFLMDRRLEVEVTRVSDFRGKGLPEAENYKKLSLNSHMIPVKNVASKHFRNKANYNNAYSDLCFLAAINIGIEHKKFEASFKTTADQTAWRDARQQTSKKFVQNVEALHVRCNIDFAHGCSSEKIQEVEHILQDYRLVVYDGRSNLSVRYRGYSGPDKKTTLFLFYNNDENHFHYITRIAAFLGTRIFCDVCEMGVNNKIHKCGSRERCKKCSTHFKSETAENTSVSAATHIKCSGCNVSFYSDMCYSRHLDNKLCETRKVCLDCGFMYKIIKNDSAHVCGSTFCKNCRKHCPQPHHCFVKKLPAPKHPETKDAHTLVSFADFESRQEDMIATGVYQHMVNLAHVETTCIKCRDREIHPPEICIICGPRSHTIDSLDDPDLDVLSEFLEYCAQKAARKKLSNNTLTPKMDHVVLFHFGQGYDTVFILQTVLDSPLWHINSIILNGRKIMKLEMTHLKTGVCLKILDFFNYIPKSLSSLSAAFKLPETSIKGDFPHYFNKKENYNFCESYLPNLDFWQVDNMNEKQRQRIMEWHSKEDARLRATGERFNFKKALRDYCVTDCIILRQSGTIFRNEFIKRGTDPFLDCFTLASLCSRIYRMNYYSEGSIGLIPKNGYRGKQSLEGLMYLAWCEIVEGHEISHAGTQKEIYICGSPVDGYYEANGEKIVYE